MKVRIAANTVFPSGIKVDAESIVDLDPNMQISKNFKLKELANNKAKDAVKAWWNSDVAEHCVMLQELRNEVGELTVNSWERTQSFNKSCGGSSNSLHLKGLATDLAFRKMSDTKYRLMKSVWTKICSEHGKVGGINRYSNGVHVSSREDLFGYKTFVERNYVGKQGDW